MAGGGIGGLAAAIGLRRAGWSVTVLERRPGLREIGAGWSFAPNAVRAADALGVGDDFRAVSVPTQAGATLHTPDGRYLMRFRPGRGTALLANHRADLHRTLLAHVPAECVRAAAEVTGIEQSDHKAVVTYRTPDGRDQIAADLVVGADGIHSAVRRSVFPKASAPVFQRILCWRGVSAPGSVWAARRVPDLGFVVRGSALTRCPDTACSGSWPSAETNPAPDTTTIWPRSVTGSVNGTTRSPPL